METGGHSLRSDRERLAHEDSTQAYPPRQRPDPRTKTTRRRDRPAPTPSIFTLKIVRGDKWEGRRCGLCHQRTLWPVNEQKKDRALVACSVSPQSTRIEERRRL